MNIKTQRCKTMDLEISKGKPFSYETPDECPKAHINIGVCSKRGSGKTEITVNLLEKMNYDRIFVISPTMLSNKDVMARLNIEEEDIYEDPDDISCLDKIKEQIEEEAKTLDKYLDDIKKYNLLMRLINRKDKIDIPDELLVDFYNPMTGNFDKPTHKWGGRRPMCALLCDDCIGSMLYTKGIRRLNKMVILHRHIGGLTNMDGAIGLSLIFLLQSYIVQFGGVSTTMRNNFTHMLLGKTKNEKELNKIVEEFSGEISPEQFLKVYTYATNEQFGFLFVDLHKKDNHPSMFRKNLNEFIIVEDFCDCESKGLPKGSCGKMVDESIPDDNVKKLMKKPKQKGKKKDAKVDDNTETP